MFPLAIAAINLMLAPNGFPETQSMPENVRDLAFALKTAIAKQIRLGIYDA